MRFQPVAIRFDQSLSRCLGRTCSLLLRLSALGSEGTALPAWIFLRFILHFGNCGPIFIFLDRSGVWELWVGLGHVSTTVRGLYKTGRLPSVHWSKWNTVPYY